ncbi:hypothetical protein ACK8OR_02745 [Jannaschia sp. KMU-145]|uniref:hypothetical protein n=1 Tax=Jannaschia halovivens TaxID=3388667 RepID=UPI00396B263A
MRMMVLILLGLAAALAIGAKVHEVATTPLDVTPYAPARPDTGPETAPQDAGPLDVAALDRNQVLSRPLFTETRRPWQPPPAPPPPPPPVVAAPAPAPPPPPEPDPIAPRLIGVARSDGQSRALLGAPEGFETIWLREGEVAWNWTVSEIDAGSVTVRQDDHVVPLGLHGDGARP